MGNWKKEFLRVAGYGLRVASRLFPVAGRRLPAARSERPEARSRHEFQLLPAVILLTLISCGTPLPKMEGIDLTEWKNDKNGCSGLREKMTELVIQQKDKLLSLTETDIVNLLGKPDETELYKRNEKFYTYYFSNGPGCAGAATRKSITLRFNAMGLLKEAVVD